VLVNELLRAEAADAGLEGGSLVTTELENVGDGGVDASLEATVSTKYLPKGRSAWQFKAGDLPPAKCTKELRDAKHALEILHAGGKYRLVVGADINARQVVGRRQALEEEAKAQGVRVKRDTIKVLNASDLANWAAEHPSLAVSPLLGGIAHVALNVAAWSASTGLTETWVPNSAADEVTAAVDELVTGTDAVAWHVEGVSGMGKTRAVLEALRGKSYEPLVAYVHAVDALPPNLVYQLHRQGRHAILVVDECDARTHEVLAHQIPVGSKVRLITIGTPSGYRPRAEAHKIGSVDDLAMRQVLRLNQPALPPETARVVVGAAAGNVKLALLLANDIVRRPASTASALITPEIIESYVTGALPSGTGLLACAALALFTSIGFDFDLAGELEIVSTALGLSVLDLRSAAAGLDRDGLLSRQGRFRAVSPYPLAIYLAAQGWEQFSNQIMKQLLPSLNESMVERFLQRAADVGDFDPIRRVVTQLLAPGGRFEDAGLSADGERDGLLVHLAVLAPHAIADRLATALAALTDDERKIIAAERHEVVWTLEKLAWHGATFRRAADGLLSLAIVTEGRGSQLRARSWTDLFGVMLPATSADPASRIQYLAETARSLDRRIRRLAGAAATRACSAHETIAVSPEIQGGFLVASRGTPATYGEAWDYCAAAMDILAELANDQDKQISRDAIGGLVATIHPYLQRPVLRERLARALTRLPAEGLTKVRTQIEHLRGLFERTQAKSDTDDRLSGLEAFISMLPIPSAEEDFEALANAQPWDFRDENELQHRLDKAALGLPAARRIPHILKVVATRPAAARELGRTLNTVADGSDEILAELISQAAAGNIDPLTGYLQDRVYKGTAAAFDDLLDSDQSAALDDAARLAISVRGPQTVPGWQRVESLVQRLSPLQGARTLFGWHISLDLDRLNQFLSDWMCRLGSQADYNTVVDFVGLAIHQQPPWQANIDPMVAALVARRIEYPDVGNQDWEWTQLAKRQLDQQPSALHETLLLLLENDAWNPFESSEDEADAEDDLLRETIRRAGPAGWRKTMERLDASPRLRTSFGCWLAGAVDLAEVEAWVGTDLDRARLVARVAIPGGDHVSPVGRFLLKNFGADDGIASALHLNYMIGVWRGNYSAHCQTQIDQLTGWVNTPAEPQQVKDWAQSLAAKLTAERDRALQNEAEGSW
jgi:hypothetical protein